MQTTSWAATRSFSRCTAFARASGDWCLCPGMGISISTASASASGITALTASQAAAALGLPSAASRCVKRLWRTGFERETLPESTKVMRRTPQPIRARARWQPSVPAPSKRKRRPFIRSGSSSGNRRHFMSLTLRSTASAAMRPLSRNAVRSKFWIFVQPANCASGGGGEDSSAAVAASAGASTKKTRERTGASAALAARPGSRKARKRCRPGLCRATARTKLRSGHPGAASAEDESTNATTRSPSGTAADSAKEPSLLVSQAAPAPLTRRKAPAAASAASSRSSRERRQSSSRSNPASSTPHGAA
mmetsp:Transcript_71303/g.220353  ORF Transcript_71303/g.220353 Transcript_71303/m.220353 type:complete len:306 (+) Transcript_71303:699-1616(+)